MILQLMLLYSSKIASFILMQLMYLISDSSSWNLIIGNDSCVTLLDIISNTLSLYYIVNYEISSDSGLVCITLYFYRKHQNSVITAFSTLPTK